MEVDSDDDPTKRSLFPVLDLSLESLGGGEQHLFLSLVVLARGVLAPASMLASIWQKVRARFQCVGWSIIKNVLCECREFDAFLRPVSSNIGQVVGTQIGPCEIAVEARA